ncbi:MAG: hypothetical protein HQK50_10330 [Oligoflexia bacterium]|nr:hypothetical protein [Oligoflexia bacterium]MBF0365958.1 hypothetical protein [Oligoflexia bacterium]
MNYILMSLALFIFTLPHTLFAATMPTPPEDCFAEQSYCHKYEIVYDNDIRYIEVTIHAEIDASEFATSQDIINRYFDFDHWFEYLDGKDAVRLVTSTALPTTVEADGREYIWHFSHYYTKAPFPLWSMQIKEVSYYRKIVPNPYADAQVAWEFDLKKGRIQIPSLGEDFTDSWGLKYKYGQLFARFDQEKQKYYVLAVTRVIPSIDLLPSVAAPYIEASMLAIFQGVFDL